MRALRERNVVNYKEAPLKTPGKLDDDIIQVIIGKEAKKLDHKFELELENKKENITKKKSVPTKNVISVPVKAYIMDLDDDEDDSPFVSEKSKKSVVAKKVSKKKRKIEIEFEEEDNDDDTIIQKPSKKAKGGEGKRRNAISTPIVFEESHEILKEVKEKSPLPPPKKQAISKKQEIATEEIVTESIPIPQPKKKEVTKKAQSACC